MALAVREVVASAARTTTGNSGALVVGGSSAIRGRPADINLLALILGVQVTVVSGAGANLALAVEWSMDGTNFGASDPADALTALTATGNRVKTFTVKGTHYRIVWTITGTTPSFTFKIDELVDAD